MSYIKKMLRNVTLSLAILLCFTFMVPAGIAIPTLFAEPTAEETDAANVNILKIDKLQNQTKVGQAYLIPKATFGGAPADVVAKDEYDKEITIATVTVEDITNPADSKDNYFGKITPDRTGTIYLVYTYKDTNNNKVYSQTFEVKVVKGTTTFKFPENVKEIIPKKIGKDYIGRITLPTPEVLDKNDNPINIDGTNNRLVVTVQKPLASSEAEPDFIDLLQDDNNNYYFGVNGMDVGIYTITYKYYIGSVFILSDVQTIDVKSNYDNDFKISYDFTGSVPSDGKLAISTGVTRELPGVKAINKTTNEEVASYYTVRVEREEDGKWVDVTNSQETIHEKPLYNAKDNEFTPTKDGNYRFIYTVKDFFGHEAEYTGASLTAPKVKDNEKPTPLVVDAEENYTEASSKLKNKYSNDNVKIYAVGAEDNASTTREEFKEFTLRIYNSGGTIVFQTSEYSDKNLIFNYDETSYGSSLNEEDIANAKVVVARNYMNSAKTVDEATKNDPIKLAKGSYTAYYVVKDGAGNQNSEHYSFSIEEGEYLPTHEPEVSFVEAFYSSYKRGDEITFSKPSATDKDDTRMDINVTYKYNDGEEKPADLEKDEKTYKIVIPEDTSATTLTIIARAENDYGKIGKAEVVLNIENTGDLRVPIIKKVEYDSTKTYKQNDDVELPTVTVTDDKLEYTNIDIDVTYLGETETNIIARNNSITRTKGQLVSSGATFTASFAGDYQVRYIVTDGAGNTKVVFFNYTVDPVTVVGLPTIDKNPTEINNGVGEYYESIKIPAVEVNFTNKETHVAEWEIRVVEAPGNYTINNNYFTPKATGRYALQYFGFVYLKKADGTPNYEADANSIITCEPSKTYYIQVNDTVGPTLADYDYPSVMAKGKPLDIKRIKATDHAGIDMSKSKITLSSNKYGSTTLTQDSDDGNYSIILRHDDLYTLTYEVYDNNGISTTKKFEIRVGDTESPVIEVEDDIMPSKVNLNDKLSFDLGKIKVSDNITEVKVTEVEITVKNTSTNEDVEMNEDGTFTISKAGTYEVRFTIKDNAQNESYSIKTFVIDANENSGTISTQVIGTILIVVAVLVLAGVIIYFIVSSQKLKKDTKKKK